MNIKYTEKTTRQSQPTPLTKGQIVKKRLTDLSQMGMSLKYKQVYEGGKHVQRFSRGFRDRKMNSDGKGGGVLHREEPAFLGGMSEGHDKACLSA